LPRHPLQSSLDELVSYLSDAQNILESIHQKNADLTAQRVSQGSKTGAGAPPANQRSLNRAVVVAAVGATEAFFEDLALAAVAADPSLAPPTGWYKIDGSGGMVQTPSPYHVAKMLWTLYRYDPRPDWDIVVTTSPSETNGNGSNWRGSRTNYQAQDAANFFAAMVKVRHGFAHQDRAQLPPHQAGIVNRTPTGKIAIQSHHAENAISSVLQMAIQSTIGLSTTLGMTGDFRWKATMTRAGWATILADTPVAATIATSGDWTHHPWLNS